MVEDRYCDLRHSTVVEDTVTLDTVLWWKIDTVTLDTVLWWKIL